MTGKDPEELLYPCLRSVKEHSEDYRLILFSNGAPKAVREETRSLLEGMRYRWAESDVNLGPAKAHNVPLALSTAPFVVLLNDDTEVVQGWLPNQKRLFEFERVGIVAPCVTNGQNYQHAATQRAPRNSYQLDVPIIFPYCAMYSRECIDAVGGYFSEDYFSGWDQDFCFRAKKLGFRFAVDHRTVIKHRWHGVMNTFSGSHRTEAYQRDIALLKERFGEFF